MGIAGLLPALKPIQLTRHLSHFSGQTIAVDAYVWLHKGIYACATDLATGKPTHKYVDYAMHRVRLLRYHNIEPYIVFDGGPLPAKRGTEVSRKQARDEYLARGNALAAQGRHSDARECYVKCADVTPQMAYQLIKALRAENVSYIVAPYEADAQLAYLERIGLADGILTEDSDLLVYGCRTVLFKLDTNAATVVSVSRKDFGAIAFPSSEISLVGWSDVQFRAMAILSGCDYLPSIPGIGLKTACTLLRKWKTVNQVVKVLLLEGKKSVPKDYLKRFEMAEKCFLHQRVYCPLSEKLVHLADINGEEWNDEYDAYVGRLIDPDSAQSIARGDTDPISCLPMNDINPSYMPASPKASAHATRFRSHNSKGKAREDGKATPKSGGILDFFGPNPLVTPHPAMSSIASRPLTPLTVPRKGSGKRTLADVMEQDITRRKQKKQGDPTSVSPSRLLQQTTRSKFFSNTNMKMSNTTSLVTNSSCFSPTDKENVSCSPDSCRQPSRLPANGRMNECEAVSDVSHCADDGAESIDLNIGNEENVQQEEGYISPFEMASDSENEPPELSSPVRPLKKKKKLPPTDSRATANAMQYIEDEEDFGADVLSSPLAVKTWTASNMFKQWEYRSDKTVDTVAAPTIGRRQSFPLSSFQTNTDGTARAEVEDVKQSFDCETGTSKSSSATGNRLEEPRDEPKEETPKVFLVFDIFSEDGTAIDLMPENLDENPGLSSGTGSSTPADSPNTPPDEGEFPQIVINDCDDDIAILDDNEVRRANEARTRAVMDGWKARWTRRPPCPQTITASRPLGKSPESPAADLTKVNPPFHQKPRKIPPSVSNLKRSETNITPRGRHSLKTIRPQPWHANLGNRAPRYIDLTAGEDEARRTRV
ncbi:exodeoxyribonuclease 1 [Amanita muscaria]